MESAIVLKVLLWGASATAVGIWLMMTVLILREIVRRRSESDEALPDTDDTTHREER